MENKLSIYQTGTVSSLVSGVYEGDCRIADVSKLGDFGLGTPDLVHGEIIIDQGVVYCADEHGTIRVMEDDEVTPFTVITEFKPQYVFQLNEISSFEALELAVDEHLSTLNAIYAVRISGHFDYIKARSECAQERPFKPLYQTLPKKQRVFEWYHTTGTMVATRFPTHLASVNVAGYHLHFIDEKKSIGGHVFALEATGELEVAVCKLDRLIIDSIDNQCFNATDIIAVSEDKVKQVEKIRT